MSHFTVLTAVQLPENIEAALAQMPNKYPTKKMISALIDASFGKDAALKALTAHGITDQLRFEQVVEDLVEDLLLPYDENTEEPKYREFIDCTEECRQKYETGGEDFVRLLDGRQVPVYSSEFYRLYEVYEGKVYKRRFGPLHHRKRTKKARRMTVQFVPFKQQYPTFEQFAEEYHGYHREEGTGNYGYYTNPNAKWDWYQIGGRWPNRFLVKSDCQMVFTSVPEDGEPLEAPEGYCWVTGARKCDIAWDVMRAWRVKYATERFHNLETWYHDGKIPKEEHFLVITDEGIRAWSEIAYVKDESLEDYLARKGLSEAYQYPISTFAYLGDSGWEESGEMGWFGMSSNDKEELVWNQMVEKFIADLPDDTMLVSVDCHI